MCDEIWFSFDGDRAGRAAAWKALENALPQIREGRQIRFVFLPEGQDPDSFVQQHGADAFVKALDEAMPLSDFLIEELSSQVDTGSVDGLARLAELARPLVSRIPPGVYRELLTGRLADTVGLPTQKLETILKNDQAPAGGRRPAGTTRLRPKGVDRNRETVDHPAGNYPDRASPGSGRERRYRKTGRHFQAWEANCCRTWLKRSSPYPI